MGINGHDKGPDGLTSADSGYFKSVLTTAAGQVVNAEAAEEGVAVADAAACEADARISNIIQNAPAEARPALENFTLDALTEIRKANELPKATL